MPFPTQTLPRSKTHLPSLSYPIHSVALPPASLYSYPIQFSLVNVLTEVFECHLDALHLLLKKSCIFIGLR